MPKAELQHNHMHNQPAQRQGGNAALESPQGEQIAQLEAMAEASPQSGKLAQLEAMANNSQAAAVQRRMMDMIHASPRMAAQRQAASGIHDSSHTTAQRRQLDSFDGGTAQREASHAKPNNTGLPDNLKCGIESLSGMSMDNVKVHYNSSQPAQLNALAYAQGTDIHVAPGQEQHLPHEAWHVVQQAQGRVKPTMQMKEGEAQGKSIESGPADSADIAHPVQLAMQKSGTTLDGKTTNVNWESDTLNGAVVGVEMTADPLGPDHIQGGPPGYGEQSKLMNALNTDPTDSAPDKYIRGHLLNDNLGGEGKAYNLFPITANANKEHNLRIEEQVKTWVNVEKQWVKYHVEVNNVDESLDSTDPSDNYVDAEFECRAAVLDPTDMQTEVKSVSATIKSEYLKGHTAEAKYTNNGTTLPDKGMEAHLANPLLSTSKKTANYKFNDALFDAIKELYVKAYIDDAADLFSKIEKIAGLGTQTVEAYKTFITEAMESGNAFDDALPKDAKGVLTRLNNHTDVIILAIKKFIAEIDRQEDEDDDYEESSMSESDSGSDSEDETLTVPQQLERIVDTDEAWNESAWKNLKQTVYGTNRGGVESIIRAIDEHLSGNKYYATYKDTFVFLLRMGFK